MINTVSLGIAAGATSAVESTVSKYILHEKFQFDTKVSESLFHYLVSISYNYFNCNNFK
jgi:hypothetical protein